MTFPTTTQPLTVELVLNGPVSKSPFVTVTAVANAAVFWAILLTTSGVGVGSAGGVGIGAGVGVNAMLDPELDGWLMLSGLGSFESVNGATTTSSNKVSAALLPSPTSVNCNVV